MDPRIDYVDETIGFRFESGFAQRFMEVGSPVDDLEMWYQIAQVFATVTLERAVVSSQRVPLVRLIEAIRLEANFPPLPGERFEFDVSGYDFTEDVLSYKSAIVDEVLRHLALER